MSWSAVIVGGATVVGGLISGKSSRDAARTQAGAADEAAQVQREALQSFEQRTQPFADFGFSAAQSLADLLGIQRPPSLEQRRLESRLENINRQLEAGPETRTTRRGGLEGFARAALIGLPEGDVEGFKETLASPLRGEGPFGFRGEEEELPFDQAGLEAERDQITQQLADLQAQAQPAGGQPLTGENASLLAQINPLVDFTRQQGFEDIQEAAAAQGSLGSGGTLRDLTTFNTQLASTIVPQLQQQRFNQLFNVLGLGANAATGQGTAGLQTASNIGNLLQSQGAARAAGQLGQGQAAGNTLSDLAGIFGARQGGAFGGFNFLNQPQSGGSASIVDPNRFRGFS